MGKGGDEVAVALCGMRTLLPAYLYSYVPAVPELRSISRSLVETKLSLNWNNDVVLSCLLWWHNALSYLRYGDTDSNWIFTNVYLFDMQIKRRYVKVQWKLMHARITFQNLTNLLTWRSWAKKNHLCRFANWDLLISHRKKSMPKKIVFIEPYRFVE